MRRSAGPQEGLNRVQGKKVSETVDSEACARNRELITSQVEQICEDRIAGGISATREDVMEVSLSRRNVGCGRGGR